MAKPIFTWNPDLGARRISKPSVKPTKFGDGYEVRVPIGINTSPAKWMLRFTRNYAEASLIFAFLETQAATTAFTWTDTYNVTAVYVCREWDMAQTMFGVFELNCVFDQVFEF
jgi:phage-related protein